MPAVLNEVWPATRRFWTETRQDSTGNASSAKTVQPHANVSAAALGYGRHSATK